MTQWQQFKKIQRGHGIADPNLVCIDIQPYRTSQAPERNDILNIGGFSDAVFNVVNSFLENDASRFVREVDSIELQNGISFQLTCGRMKADAISTRIIHQKLFDLRTHRVNHCV